MKKVKNFMIQFAGNGEWLVAADIEEEAKKIFLSCCQQDAAREIYMNGVHITGVKEVDWSKELDPNAMVSGLNQMMDDQNNADHMDLLRQAASFIQNASCSSSAPEDRVFAKEDKDDLAPDAAEDNEDGFEDDFSWDDVPPFDGNIDLSND